MQCVPGLPFPSPRRPGDEASGYSDTGVGEDGGHPWTVPDGLCISGIHGYSDTGVGEDGRHPWNVPDGLCISGIRGYLDTGVGEDGGHPWTVPVGLCISGVREYSDKWLWRMVDILGPSRMVCVSPV